MINPFGRLYRPHTHTITNAVRPNRKSKHRSSTCTYTQYVPEWCDRLHRSTDPPILMTGTNFTIRQNGLGSFHAFHAAVVLAIGLLSPDSATEFVETKGILSKSLQQFASLSVRSIFCNKWGISFTPRSGRTGILLKYLPRVMCIGGSTFELLMLFGEIEGLDRRGDSSEWRFGRDIEPEPRRGWLARTSYSGGRALFSFQGPLVSDTVIRGSRGCSWFRSNFAIFQSDIRVDRSSGSVESREGQR